MDKRQINENFLLFWLFYICNVIAYIFFRLETTRKKKKLKWQLANPDWMFYLTDYIKFKTSCQMLQTKISHENQILLKKLLYQYFVLSYNNQSHCIFILKTTIIHFGWKHFVIYSLNQPLYLQLEKYTIC